MGDTQRIVRRTTNVVTRQLAGEIVLVPITQTSADFQQVHLLNNTAAAVWEALEEPRTLDELVSLLAERYDTSEQTIADDVEELLTGLHTRGLVAWSSDDE